MLAVHHAPGDYLSGKEGDVLTVDFQVATDTQEETDRYWDVIVIKDGEESCVASAGTTRGISWQITPRVLTKAMAAGGKEAKRAFSVMMEIGRIDVAKVEASRRG